MLIGCQPSLQWLSQRICLAYVKVLGSILNTEERKNGRKRRKKISNYVFYTKSDSLLTYFIFPVHLYFACIMFV